MTERYFNRDQEAHMASLARIPREQRCVSGWHMIGECGESPCQPHAWSKPFCANCKVQHLDPSQCPWVG